MYRCPKCGRYMTWYMSYNFGMAWSGWKFECGYDTNQWSNNTVITPNTTGRVRW